MNYISISIRFKSNNSFYIFILNIFSFLSRHY
nr:MAG TPA: hypothetical protein [Caudoviricetes sp.]